LSWYSAQASRRPTRSAYLYNPTKASAITNEALVTDVPILLDDVFRFLVPLGFAESLELFLPMSLTVTPTREISRMSILAGSCSLDMRCLQWYACP
jgi:hypothetical protein